MCTDADFLLKVTEIPGKQAFVPSGNKKYKLERRHLRTKIGKVHLCQITESLGPQVVMSGWHSADSGKSLEVFKERSDQVRKEFQVQLATPMRYKSRERTGKTHHSLIPRIHFGFTVQQSQRDSPSYWMGIRWIASAFWSHSQRPETTTMYYFLPIYDSLHISADLAGLSHISEDLLAVS